MTHSTLDVSIAGTPAGTLTQGDNDVTFTYLAGYQGVCLSTAMPLSTRAYHSKTVLPYLWGLLPEDPATRKRIAQDAGVSHNNPFALLSVIGLDCPGAVQLYPHGSSTAREEQLVQLSESDIAERLAQGRNGNSSWVAQNEHWSLGGQQNKFALRKCDDKWFSCEGAAATTHIFKSGVQGLAHQALNEYVCMRLAHECGIDTAQVEYQEFHGEDGVEPAIVITRYDRTISGQTVTRAHQEDLCQALSCLPENKYTMDGGPNVADVLALLSNTGTQAGNNIVKFLQMLFFNYLIAATDAHAKNYSLMLRADGNHQLAPMYDVASIAPYIKPKLLGLKPPKLAMSIGGENRAGKVTMGCLRRMVEHCGLEDKGVDVNGCAELIRAYASIIPDKLASIFDELEGTSNACAAKELRVNMEAPITQLCTLSAAQL